MTSASLSSPSKASSVEWLSEKVQAFESKVSEMSRRLAGTDSMERRLEMLQERTDLLEKIFLFVDIEVLNKAIAATTGHKCGPPVLLPACQVPSHLCGKSGSLMRASCGSTHRTLLGSHRTSKSEPQKVVAKPKEGALAAGGESVAAMEPAREALANAPASGLACRAASADSWSDAWASPMEPIPEPDSAGTSPSTSPSNAKRTDASEGPMTLIAAADAGRTDVVTMLLEGRADPDARSVDGETALHRAAYWAKQDIVELLLDARSDPSARDKKGKTPMRKSYDNPDIVAALLRAGAGPNAVDESGRTTLHRSAENGHVDVIEVLVKAGADANIGNLERETPLHEAANFGQVGSLQVLLRAKGNVDAEDTYGATPLHFAAYGGHASIAKILVEAGADILKVNKDGEIPLKSAEQGKKTEVAEFLRAQGCVLSSDSEVDSQMPGQDCDSSPTAGSKGETMATDAGTACSNRH